MQGCHAAQFCARKFSKIPAPRSNRKKISRTEPGQLRCPHTELTELAQNFISNQQGQPNNPIIINAEFCARSVNSVSGCSAALFCAIKFSIISMHRSSSHEQKENISHRTGAAPLPQHRIDRTRTELFFPINIDIQNPKCHSSVPIL